MTHTSQQLENDVRETVESGIDIYERVRDITLKALSERELDIDNIKAVVEAALKGISSGVGNQYEPAKEAFEQSTEALDDALEKTAQASKLAIEEAASRMNEFSQHDVNRAAEELKSLEEIFLDTVEKVTKDSNEALSGIARDFIEHARQNGTAVGKQAQIAFDALNNLRHRGQDAVIAGAVTTTSTLAKIASGILAGIAESLRPENPNQ
ncbi:MAG: DUF6781 family protein [Gammaproteobacteria bacterium]